MTLVNDLRARIVALGGDPNEALALPHRNAAEPSARNGQGANGDRETAELILLPAPAATESMPHMAPQAYYGLAGDVVRALEPTTEADPVAMLVTFLTMFGNACGRNPHILIGDDRHGTNLFTVLVGETARARKGTSQSGPRRLLALADPEWEKDRVQGGISTGEGLIWAVHD
jgi:hypothetical protein